MRTLAAVAAVLALALTGLLVSELTRPGDAAVRAAARELLPSDTDNVEFSDSDGHWLITGAYNANAHATLVEVDDPRTSLAAAEASRERLLEIGWSVGPARRPPQAFGHMLDLTNGPLDGHVNIHDDGRFFATVTTDMTIRHRSGLLLGGAAGIVVAVAVLRRRPTRTDVRPPVPA